MSKLTEKLKKVGQSESAPMGFGAFTARAKNPPLLLLAGLSAAEAGAASQALSEGADGLLLGLSGDPEQAKGILAAAGEAPVGVGLAEATKDTVQALQNAGVDFVVLTSLATPAGVLQMDGPAKLLEVDPSWGDTMLRTVEGLPVEGALLRVSGPFTVEAWMGCLRVAGLARKTLLVVLDGPVDTDTLASVRDAGASGVVVAPATVSDARRLIDTLPSPKRRRDRGEALLPAMTRSAPVPHEHDDED